MHAGPRRISFYVSCDVLNQAQLTLEELNLTIDSALKLISAPCLRGGAALLQPYSGYGRPLA